MQGFQKALRVAVFNKKTFIVISVLRTVTNLMTIGNALIFGELINMVARGEDLSRIGIAVLLTAAYCLLWCGLHWISALITQKYIINVRQAYRCKYLDALLDAKYNAVAIEDSSTYINSVNDDIDNVVATSIYNCTDIFGCVISIVASFCSALFLRWEIALTMVGFTVIMAILPFFIKKRLENSIVENSKQKGEFIGVLKENLLGLSVIKSYGGERQCAARIKGKDDEYKKATERMTVINVAAGQIPNTVRQIALVTLIAATCYFVYIKKVEVGAVLSIFSIGQSFYGYILYAASITTSIFSVGGIIDKIGKVIDLPVRKSSGEIEFNDKIELKNVSFGYPTDERKQVLRGIDLQITRNGKYLILGASGSGKSTVIKLLAKLYDEYDGEISIDGVDYREYGEKDISNILSLSQQDGYLFHRTLRDNIDFLGEGNEALLEKTVELCMLKDFVNSLPDGLNTVLDEEINQVSGGEKLRINLARAVYKKGKLLLLDEVTSALDKTTSDKVEHNILALTDRTIVNVCHKFNDGTLPLYDEIVIIENGEITLKGKFDDMKDNPKLALYRNIREN